MQLIKQKNYRIYVSEKTDGNIKDFNKFKIFKGIQTHSDKIITLDNLENYKLTEADGIISNIKNIKLGVYVADCNGIIITGKNRYGAVHAGRKGLENKTTIKAIQKLKSKGEKIENLNIFIGPSNRVCSYEVGEEFISKFGTEYIQKRGGRIYLDMIKYLKDQLIKIGISNKNISVHPDCTQCTKKYFSYRGGNKTNRFLVGVEKII